jgi:hypothetical protein
LEAYSVRQVVIVKMAREFLAEDKKIAFEKALRVK